MGDDALKPLPMDNLDEDGRQMIFSLPLEDYDPSKVSAIDALRFGIQVEESSILFYGNAAKIVGDNAIKNVLNGLVEFEREHLILLTKNLKQLELDGTWIGQVQV